MKIEGKLEFHQRQATRLQGYDYAMPGMYFVTICTHNHICTLGAIEDDLVLSNAGHIVQACWEDLPNHYHVVLDMFIIMPNHVHGIIVLTDEAVGAGVQPARATEYTTGREGYKPSPTTSIHTIPSPTTHDATEQEGHRPSSTKKHGLSEIIRGFKTFSARRINRLHNTPGVSVWQRSYYDHIIRNEKDLQRIRQYIHLNPSTWVEDSLYRVP